MPTVDVASGPSSTKEDKVMALATVNEDPHKTPRWERLADMHKIKSKMPEVSFLQQNLGLFLALVLHFPDSYM
jgi:hypothetical protein